METSKIKDVITHPDSTIIVEEPIVEEAYQHLKNIFIRHIQNAMLETGQYLIEKFYDNDYNLAQEKKFTKNKSLLQLFSKIQGDSTGNVPGKTWLYDSINLAIDENKYCEVSAYGRLGHSHKVKLTNTGKLPEETKINLIEETAEKEYSVSALQERIVQEKQKLDGNHILLKEEMELNKLKKLDIKQLENLKKQTEKSFTKVNLEMIRYKMNLKKINAALKTVVKDNQKKEKVSGFQEWIKKGNSVNICTGCPNDCKYCFAKNQAVYHYKQVPEGQWAHEIIRQHDVDKKRKLHNGTVGFPTSHDISPTNIDAYIAVLEKLLNFGNDILIVSKPNLECIKRICAESIQYKDKILFRFSIGAMDNSILNFWDTNAPSYEERKESLKYAFNNGFKTSVSMEPLLDSANVVETASDLVPYVTDFIWIGKMNRAGHLKTKAKKENDSSMLARYADIENGQTDEKIKAIYADFQKLPELFKKLKWKDSFKKVLGIESAKEPGMDV